MRVLRAFEVAVLEYVLIGAAAMAFHGLVQSHRSSRSVHPRDAENIENAL